jgi:hypothetical protein
MKRFYFDLHENSSISRDEDGVDLPNLARAEEEACLTLGEAAKEFARRCKEGRLAVTVRDEQGPVMEIAATFRSKLLR